MWLLLQKDVLQISRLREPQPTRVGFSPFGGGQGGGNDKNKYKTRISLKTEIENVFNRGKQKI